MRVLKWILLFDLQSSFNHHLNDYFSNCWAKCWHRFSSTDSSPLGTFFDLFRWLKRSGHSGAESLESHRWSVWMGAHQKWSGMASDPGCAWHFLTINILTLSHHHLVSPFVLCTYFNFLSSDVHKGPVCQIYCQVMKRIIFIIFSLVHNQQRFC